MPKEEKQYCEHCEQEWEESFFCKKCSNQNMGAELEEVPDPMWDGFGDEMTWKMVDQYSGDVCMNCCNCNLVVG